MTEEIDRQILRKYDIESKLGKGVQLRQQTQSAACERVLPATLLTFSHVAMCINTVCVFEGLRYCLESY